MTPEEIAAALDIARGLAKAGVPLFTAEPHLDGDDGCGYRWCKGPTNTGYHLPLEWERSIANPGIVEFWASGMALCAVMGHVCDGLDVDPRNGGDVSASELWAAGAWPTLYGRAATPSGGWHDLIAPLRERKIGDIRPGIDVQAGDGDDDDAGRGFLFISPTVRISKVTGLPGEYRWLIAPHIEDITAADTSGYRLAEMIRDTRKPAPSVPDRAPGPAVDPGTWGAYVKTAVERRLAEVADAAEGTRDITAYKAALRLVELGNSDWNSAEVDEIYPHFMAACERASDNGALPFTAADADRKWRNAIKDKRGEGVAPPADLGNSGTRVDPSVMNPAGFGLGNGASAPRQARKAWLPDEFWMARPYLQHIRAAAHSRGRSAPAVLGADLARTAAFVNHHLVLPAIVGSQVGLSLIVTILASPGVGKSSSTRVAAETSPVPAELLKKVLADMPLGSGEGVAEMFYGMRKEATGEVDKKTGEPKTKLVRAQVRHNALIHVDEGQVIYEMGNRRGATLLPAIRSAFTGGTLGQFNANPDNRRVVEAGTYTLGMTIALQETLAAELLRDAEAGTPQRMLWVPGDDPTIPELAGRVEWPGPLDWKPPSMALVGAPFWNGTVYIEVAYSVAAEIVAADLPRARGEVVIDTLDAHEGLLRLKLAALLAHRDSRRDINEEDWQLATAMKEASDATRSKVVAVVKESAERREGEYAQKLAKRAATAESVAGASRVLECAGKIAAKVWAEPERWTFSGLRKIMPRWHPVYPEGVDEAVRLGWVVVVEEPGQGEPKRNLRPGAVRPT